MEDTKGVIRGECQKCSSFCIEYNINCLLDMKLENLEECIKKDVCAMCDCPASMHKVYTFASRGREAYENTKKIYSGYTMENALMASVKDTEHLNLPRSNFTYGEISLLSFPLVMALANPKDGDIFYDLGCGAAKPVLYASFLHDFKKCVGIELLPSVYNVAKGFAAKYAEAIKSGSYAHTSDYEVKDNVSIIQGSFLEVDFSDADIIYLPCTTFTTGLMKDIGRCCAKLKPGARIISLTKPLPCLTEESCKVIFNVYHKEEFLMSWGLEPVFFQTKEN